MSAVPTIVVAAPPLSGEEIVAASRRALTARQQQVLDFIRSHAASNGYPPTLREIGKHMGIRSTNGVNDHLRALERKGAIRRRDGLSRGSVPVDGAGAETSFSNVVNGWRSENAALLHLLDKVAKAAVRLPKLTPEFIVLLGDVRDAVDASKAGA